MTGQPGGSSGSDERMGCRKRQGRTREGAALLAGAELMQQPLVLSGQAGQRRY